MIIIILLLVIIVLLRKPKALRKAEKLKERQELNDDLNHLVDKAIAKMKGNK